MNDDLASSSSGIGGSASSSVTGSTQSSPSTGPAGGLMIIPQNGFKYETDKTPLSENDDNKKMLNHLYVQQHHTQHMQHIQHHHQQQQHHMTGDHIMNDSTSTPVVKAVGKKRAYEKKSKKINNFLNENGIMDHDQPTDGLTPTGKKTRKYNVKKSAATVTTVKIEDNRMLMSENSLLDELNNSNMSQSKMSNDDLLNSSSKSYIY